MFSLTDLKSGDVVGILLALFIAGFGFYFALILSETITLTVASVLPESESEVVTSWINLFVAIFIVAIGVYLIVWWFSKRRKDVRLRLDEI
jgi:uncharacterized membrane protein YbhN (UPF0104 family)